MNLKYNNEVYYYIKNGQNDIIGILDNNYNKIVEYIYDSWGNILEIKDNSINNIGIINPFRYRSYYYDNETKLYYLNSRYYNPLWGRFINCDGIIGANEDILSYNLYAYCSNNPVNMIDLDGKIGFLLGCLIIFTAATFTTGALVSVAKQTAKTGKVNPKKVVKDAAKGFTVEVGVGTGYSNSKSVGVNDFNAKASAGGYQDFNVGISNGKAYTSTSAQIGTSIELSNLVKGNLNISYEHVQHPVTYSNFMHNSPVTMPWDVWNCNYTSKNIGLGLEKNDISGEINNNNAFVGFSYEKHLLIGGHVKIGYTYSD